MANSQVMISLPLYEGFLEFAIWFEPQSVSKLIILYLLNVKLLDIVEYNCQAQLRPNCQLQPSWLSFSFILHFIPPPPPPTPPHLTCASGF